jgi:glycosyltransferase involved in cell wall biosynthesis
LKLPAPNNIRQTKRIFDHSGAEVPSTSGGCTPLPRITVVTVASNDGGHFEECLNSVLDQGYPNLEYIVVGGDDADGAADIVGKYAQHLVHLPGGGGQALAAIEGALTRSSGDVMAWVAPDGRLWPGALQCIAEAFAAHPEIDWLTGRGTAIDADGSIVRIERLPSLTHQDYLDPERRNFLQREGTFWRRTLWQRTGARLDTNLEYAADFELWLRFFAQAGLHVIDAVLGSARLSEVRLASAYQTEAGAAVRRERLTRELPADISVLPAPRIEIVTSLVPRHDELQRLAIRSWLKLGFAVTTLNPPDEEDFLRQAYPEVRIVTAPRDGRQEVGKPCVYLDDILAYMKTSPAEIVGIVNSDVFLDADAGLIEFLCREARGALVYGSRQEVDSLHSATGWTYTLGFDFFFFDPVLIAAFPKSKFMLGVPWWDYWVPFLLAQKAIPIKLLDAPIAYHVSHPVAYSTKQMRDFGRHLEELCPISRSTVLSRQINHAIKAKHPKSQKHDISVLSAYCRYEIRTAAIPLRWPSPYCSLLANALIDIEASDVTVTAIVSTYRSEAFIGECLTDLLAQTIADRLEIIVVDAASPENEAAIVADYQKRHANIRYIRTTERIGVYAAWNMAARVARGRFLMSCSTNDRLVPYALELLARALDERPEVAITFGSSLLSRSPHQTPDAFDFAGIYAWPDFSFDGLLRKPGVGPHAMWRRKLHDEFGYFDEGFTAIADQDFWLRVGRHRPLANIHDITGLYWVTEESLSGRVANAQAEYREINERHQRARAYQDWQSIPYFTKGIAAHYEERIAHWRIRPTFHVYIRHSGGGFDSLSRSIQSLSSQYYDDVRIIILSPNPAPSGITGARLAWITVPSGEWEQATNTSAPAQTPDWLLFLCEGDTLEPRTFLRLGEAIHAHPDWQMIFCDEDECNSDKTQPTPIVHFKPGINADLLLAVPYLGEVAAVSGSWLRSIGGIQKGFGAAGIYELTLRTMSRATSGAIGLINDVLLHRPSGRYRTESTPVHHLAVTTILRSQGIPALAGPGLATTTRVTYSYPGNPSVAIILVHTGSIADLEASLSSLIEKTEYPCFRIIIADTRAQRDEQGNAFLDGITRLDNAAIGIANFPPGTTSAAAIAALATVEPDDMLAIWPDSAVSVQPEWLSELVSHALRPGIGAVGPRLVNRDGLLAGTGLELGLLGPAASAYRGVRMEFGGDSSCLAAQREVSALDARCLLLNRACVLKVGGIAPDTEDLWAVDLAMRLAPSYRLIWTPYALAMVDDPMLDQESDDEEAETVPSAALTTAQSHFYQRWFARLGNDRFRNPNWARNSHGRIPDTVGALVFDPLPWKPVPKVVARLADREGCGHYRILAPMGALLASGRIRGGITMRHLDIAEMSAADADVWIFQRQITQKMLAVLEHCARYSPATRIYEIDDLITNIPEGNPHRSEFTPAVLERFRRGASLCRRLVVATEPLAAAYRHLTDETVVMPNCLPNDPWQSLLGGRRHGPRPRVGWAGSASHAADLLLMQEVVATLASEVDWVFFGRCPAQLRPHVREVHHPVPIDAYPAKLASLDLDLAIAPLEINAFNEAKSSLKLLEYGALGYPVVCSDITPYQGSFPVTRVRNRPQDWIKAIRTLAFEPALAAAKGDQLRNHVREHWMLDDHLADWQAAWLP